jgi:hypothetical protein
MAKPMEMMYFGQYKGQRITQVPTGYLLWVYGSFPKLRNKLSGALGQRGVTTERLSELREATTPLAKVPVSNEKRQKKRWKVKHTRRNDDQKQANEVARAMGHEIPFPRYQQPRELRYFNGKRGA